MQMKNEAVYYHLQRNSNRKYDIKIYSDYMLISGDYYYLSGTEFRKANNKKDIAYIKDYLGVGYIKNRSYKVCLGFVIVAMIMWVIRLLISGVYKVMNRINHFMPNEYDLVMPAWIDILFVVLLVVSFLLLLIYFFSKKQVVEISFVNKRICIPKNSITNDEYIRLYRTLNNLNYKHE